MEEDKLLKTFAKLLGAGAEDVIKEIENKKEKERKLLESFSKSLSIASNLEITIEDDEPPVVETVVAQPVSIPEIIVSQPITQEQFEEVLAIASEETIEEIPLEESGRQEEPELPVNDIINQTVVALSKVPQKDIQKAADAIPDSLRKELDIIKKSLADFHRFALRHSQMGGGGEVWLYKLNDVDYFSLKGAEDGQVLTYNATTKKWYSSFSSGGGGIDGLQTNHSNTLTLSAGYNFIPATNNQSLGSPTNRFKDLYISSNSIIIGTSTISLDPTSGGLAVTPQSGNNAGVTTILGGAIAVATAQTGYSNVAVVNSTISSIAFDTSAGFTVSEEGDGNVFVTFTATTSNTDYITANVITINTLVANGTAGSNGQILASNGTVSYWHNPFTTGATPPSNPLYGDIWFYTVANKPYMWVFDGVSSFWLDFLPNPGS